MHDNPFVTPRLLNAYDDKPFVEGDLTRPLVTPGDNPDDDAEYDYWDHVEFVIDAAADRGIYINFLPLFGMEEQDGYNLISSQNAQEYGRFLGERLGQKSNIIWCLGGDVLAETEAKKEVWDLPAKGVSEGATGGRTFPEL